MAYSVEGGSSDCQLLKEVNAVVIWMKLCFAVALRHVKGSGFVTVLSPISAHSCTIFSY